MGTVRTHVSSSECRGGGTKTLYGKQTEVKMFDASTSTSFGLHSMLVKLGQDVLRAS